MRASLVTPGAGPHGRRPARDGPAASLGEWTPTPTAGFERHATDTGLPAREILPARQRIDEIFAEHTGQPVEQVHRDMERDRFFKAPEAVEYGLIDRVIESH